MVHHGKVKRPTEQSRSARAATGVRAQLNRSDSELLLQLAVEVGSIGVFETDLRRKRTRFSPELCAILGLPVGTELGYAAAARIIHKEDRDIFAASVEAAAKARDRGKFNCVCRVVRFD